jgi:C1A family cysteine protease
MKDQAGKSSPSPVYKKPFERESGTMEKLSKRKTWIKAVIAIAILGFILNIPRMGAARPVHAQTAPGGFSWEYQLDFPADSPEGARQAADSVIPRLADQGVTTQLEPLTGSMYRLSMAGSQGLDQLRQTVFSPLLANFTGGVIELEVDMPVTDLLDIPFKLETNITTGFNWELAGSSGVSFSQSGDPVYTTRSRGYGVPGLETMLLHPQFSGNAAIQLVYRRAFQPDEAATRHLYLHLETQALELDLSDPNPTILAPLTSPGDVPQGPNPIDQIPQRGVLPSSWDWRTYGIVTPIRDQGGCGGCWAFGTVGVMESAILKSGGPATDLSEQFLISCNTSGWSCSGGWTAHYWHYDTLGKNQTTLGAVLETDKPYTQTNGTCSLIVNHPYKLSGWEFIVATETTMPTVDAIKNAIYTYGPITAGVCADSGWDNYHSGVYNPATNACSGGTNHQIDIVGWNDSTSSWIVRNQWGASWGESGYMELAYDTTGTHSRVGEGTSWVTWTSPLPGPFVKSGPANGSFNQTANPTLSWSASSGASTYEYCIDNSKNGACNTSWVTGLTGTSVGLSGLSNGTYSWQVRARNTNGTTDADSGTWWSFTVGAGQRVYLPVVLRTIPPAPEAFNKSAPASGATSQPTSLSLSWGASTYASSYDYCLQTGSSTSCTTSWTTVGNATSVALSGLNAGTTYSWQVRATNASGLYTYANGASTTFWTFSTTAPVSPIVNGNFESGATGWTQYSTHNWAIIVTTFATGVSARSGSYAAWLGGDAEDISFVQQQVSITAGAPYLVYWHWIGSEDACGYDYAGVLVNGTVVDSYTLCSNYNTGGWVKHSVYLGGYAGQSVALQIRAETDSSMNSNLFVDDVSMQASASGGEVHNGTLNLDPATWLGKRGFLLPGLPPAGLDDLPFFLFR